MNFLVEVFINQTGPFEPVQVVSFPHLDKGPPLPNQAASKAIF